MTDTQTMRAEFLAFCKDRALDTDEDKDAWGRLKFKHSHIDAMWDAFQAAWTRKPAAQVAGAVPKLGTLVPDSACKQGKCAMTTAGCWNGCELLKSRPLGGSYSVTIGTFPAPEPDATKVVSVADDVAKDAARYQWLRHGDNDELVIQHGPVAPDYHWLPRNARLDEMIDSHIDRALAADRERT